MREFQSQVLELTSKVPKGKVTTYAEIARAMGKPRAYRAVANALRHNPYPIKVPCHRVVRSNGEVGGYDGSCTSGTRKKAKILESEGVEIKNLVVLLSKHMHKF